MTDDKELISRLLDVEKVTVGDAHDAAARIEALTKERDREKAYAFQCAINLDTALEQLTAARQDAKAAEDELEMQEQEACMMENDYLKLEKERDALEAKLEKAVEALEECMEEIDAYIRQEYPHDHPVQERYRQRDFAANPARLALAEISSEAALNKGESRE